MPSQVIQLPFTGGIAQKVAQEYVDPSTALLDVANGVYTKDGAIDKRLGIAALSNAAPPNFPVLGAALKLMSRGGELLATDGDQLWSYAPSGTPVWSWHAQMPTCQATRTEVASLLNGACGATFAEGGGRRMMVYRAGGTAGGNVYYSLFDTATGASIATGQGILGGTLFAPIVIFSGGHFFIFATDKTNLKGAVTDTNGTIITSSTNVVTDMHGGTFGAAFDATPYVGGTGILITYSQGAGGTGRYLRLESLPALTITASANFGGVVATITCARYDASLGSGVVWLVWEEFAAAVFTTWARAFDLTFTPLAAAFAVSGLPGIGGAVSQNTLSVEPYAAGGTAVTTFAGIFGGQAGLTWTGVQQVGGQCATDANGNSLNAGAVYPNSFICGRPFRATVAGITRVYIPIVFSEQSVGAGTYVDSTYLLDTRVTEGVGTGTGSLRPRVVASVAPRQSTRVAAAIAQTIDFRPSVGTGIGSPGAGTFRLLVATAASEEFAPTTAGTLLPTAGNYSASLVQFDFTTATAFQYAEGNGESVMSGGTMVAYDGTSPNEQSFFSWPIIVSLASDNSAGGLTPGATYGYAVCFAQLDGQGLIQRSAFFSENITLGVSDTEVVLTIQDLPYTDRFALFGTFAPVVEIYRTDANLSTFYFVASVPCSSSATAYATPLTYTDGVSAIMTHSLMPTTGGYLDSVCPPSSRALIRHVDRLWMIDDTGQVIWYSTTFGAGDAVSFNETLTLQFTQETLTALADMDDKLVVFSAEAIWYVEGYGPPNTGIGSDLTTAVSVPSDTGAGDWRSVVVVPSVGIFFQSSLNGLIYLLDRGLGVTCVGQQVQDLFAPNGVPVTVLAAGSKPNTTQVWFLLGLDPQMVVTYDYTQVGANGRPGRWARQTYAQNFRHAIVPSGGPWTAAGRDSYVYQENSAAIPAPWYDTPGGGVPTWITTTIQLANVKPGGLQGAGQLDFVQGLTRPLDPSNVTCRLTYDYAGPSETRTYTWGQLSTSSPVAPGIAMWRMAPLMAYSQPMAVQITLSDAAPTDGTAAVTGRGMRWLGVAVSVQNIGAVYNKLGTGVSQ